MGAFGAQVSICDPYIPQEIVEQQKVTRLDINDLCESCDVVVLCAAANSGTKHVLGARELQRMKQDALLINVARASLVDTDALVKELQNNHIHACVDVFDQEPLDADHPIRSCKNAYLTPHRAGGVLASGLKVLGGLIDDLEARQQQQEPQHAFKECMLSMLDG